MRRIQAKFSMLAKLGTAPEELDAAQGHLEKAQEDVQHAQERIGRVTGRTDAA
jgi:hypothetical protein